NVIKLSSKTRPGIKMKSETAWGKALCRLFFWSKQGISVQQTKRMEYPLKKCSCETNYATL
ncbi:hypothetical protein, partial [Cohnella luojiensis]|uniref:hypothetical protein n=1 Tax=Cohnella luojiensis TaxID=652876 RepID=UPI00196A4A49